MPKDDNVSTLEQDRSGVQVIRRAAQILESLKDCPDGISLSQIAERTGLARSTVHRLVSALEGERFVVAASPNGRFRLGPAISSLAASAERNFVLDFHPTMVRLSRIVNETVDLAVLDHDHVRFVDQVAATQRLRAVSAVGSVFPAYCTANGKALLSLLPEDHVRRLLPDRLERLTPNTVGQLDDLIRELADVRERGVAFDREEHTLGICAIGTAIVDSDGRAVAITVPTPVQRFYGNEEKISSALLAARKELEEAQAATGA
jgi:DNA-binding IclR family transcriptional regulator